MSGKHEIKKTAPYRPVRKRESYSKTVTLALALLLIIAATLSGTLAYLYTGTDPVENSFEPAQMSCKVSENFDGQTKTNVCIINTSDVPAYIRVALLPYYYSQDHSSIVAKSAWTPSFNPGEGWVQGNTDGFWYYTKPVPPGESTSALIPSLALEQDGVTLYHQALEIIPSCIQAYPADAVKAAWSGDNGDVTGVSNDILNVG